MTDFKDIQDKATIICGIPKAGTTLLLALLDGHPQLTVFPEEMGFFATVYGTSNPAERFLTESGFRHFRQGGVHASPSDVRDYSNLNVKQLENAIDTLCQYTRHEKRLLTGSLGIWHQIQNRLSDNKVRWVEKTPHNERFVQLYNRWFKDDAVYLHIFRDPRDNFATYKRKHPNYTLTEFVGRWALSYKIGCWAQQHIAHYYFVKYEELVTAPQQALERICRILNIQFSEVLLQPTRNGKPWRGNSMYNQNFYGISSRSLGRYKQHLSQKEIDYLESALGSFMKELGYEIESMEEGQQSSPFRKDLDREFLKWQISFGILFGYPKIYAAFQVVNGLRKKLMGRNTGLTVL